MQPTARGAGNGAADAGVRTAEGTTKARALADIVVGTFETATDAPVLVTHRRYTQATQQQNHQLH